jgi:formylglycine-generating enzyme required for sulfatase activity
MSLMNVAPTTAEFLGETANSVAGARSIAAPMAASSERHPGEAFMDCPNCPEMVVVPAGMFTMGSPASEQGRFKDEGPQHSVTIARPFAVGKLAVTVDQFSAFATESGYDGGSKCYSLVGGNWTEAQGRSWRDPGFPQTGSHPAVCLSWNDAKAYVAWLSRRTDKAYRLLTEAEWEYAARAGSTTRYFFGDEDGDFCRYANGADLTARESNPEWAVLPCDDGYLYTAPAGSFLPNAFGLYDMLGNAWQWVEDCYNDQYDGAPTDGSAWTSGDCSSHILRGGSWASQPRNLRTAVRIGGNPDVRGNSRVGFRLARVLGP